MTKEKNERWDVGVPVNRDVSVFTTGIVVMAKVCDLSC